MKKYLLLHCLALLMIACTSNTLKEPVSNTPVQKDSIVSIPEKPAVALVKDIIHLKDIELNEDKVLRKKYNSQMNAAMQKKYAIRKLDAVISDGFSYYIYDSLYSGPSVKVLLITRTWPEEHIVWLAIYDSNNQLLDHEQVFYENSEGAQLVETSIKNNLIKVTSENSFEEGANAKKTETWRIGSNNKLVKK